MSDENDGKVIQMIRTVEEKADSALGKVSGHEQLCAFRWDKATREIERLSRKIEKLFDLVEDNNKVQNEKLDRFSSRIAWAVISAGGVVILGLISYISYKIL